MPSEKSFPNRPAEGALIGEKYVIGPILGQGGMGLVFSASHRFTGREVALKWVPEEAGGEKARLLREARSLARVSHPNVVEVLDAGQDDGAVYLVTDLIHGPNLRVYARRRALPPEQAVDVLLPALAGVAAAHRQGIVHRDLKPENLIVLLDEEGLPRETMVLDFGIAKMLVSEESIVLTRTGKIVGTPSYMSPEQLLGEPAISARTDVYALGVMLFELLTSRLPYTSKAFHILAQEIVVGELPAPIDLVPELDPALSDCVRKAISFEVDERYQTVGELYDALLPFGSGEVSFSDFPRGVAGEAASMISPASHGCSPIAPSVKQRRALDSQHPASARHQSGRDSGVRSRRRDGF